MGYKKGNDVYWYYPHLKKSFGATTISSSQLIETIIKDNMTVKDVYNAINYDLDAKEILRCYIEKGYGNFIMKDFITKNPEGIFHKFDGDKIVGIYRQDLKKVLAKELKSMEQEQEIEIEM